MIFLHVLNLVYFNVTDLDRHGGTLSPAGLLVGGGLSLIAYPLIYCTLSFLCILILEISAYKVPFIV